jgi:hypothetical protein
MTSVGNLYTNLRDYFELSFVIVEVGNLYTNLRDYFELSFLMAEVGNFLYITLDPMAIIGDDY